MLIASIWLGEAPDTLHPFCPLLGGLGEVGSGGGIIFDRGDVVSVNIVTMLGRIGQTEASG
jgi:hypothetical protein